jgi:hypothetical protein
VLEEHAVPQLLFVQVGTVFAPPAGQSEAAQQPVSEIQVLVPEQRFCPVGHIPEHGALAAIHAPSQSWGALVGQVWTHAVPLQVTLPPVGF